MHVKVLLHTIMVRCSDLLLKQLCESLWTIFKINLWQKVYKVHNIMYTRNCTSNLMLNTIIWLLRCVFVVSRWSELQVWPPGALVKHVRGLFKAEGVNITAEPGNSMHGRFYVGDPMYNVQMFQLQFVQ